MANGTRQSCIQLQMMKLRKKHPDWDLNRIRKNAHAVCSQKSDYKSNNNNEVSDNNEVFDNIKSDILSLIPTGWSDRHIINVAYAMNNKFKEDFEDWCPFKFISTARIHNDYLSLFNDNFEVFEGLPLSIRMSYAVDSSLDMLREHYSDMSEPELLKLAYTLAKNRLVPDDDFVHFILMDDSFPQFMVDFVVDDISPQIPASYLLGLSTPKKEFEMPVRSLEEASIGGKSSSSNVANVGYSEGKLIVQFNNGAMYGYDVDPTYYSQLMGAESKGKFIWDVLRGKELGPVWGNPSRLTPGGTSASLKPYTKYLPSTKGPVTPGMQAKIKNAVDRAIEGYNERSFQRVMDEVYSAGSREQRKKVKDRAKLEKIEQKLVSKIIKEESKRAIEEIKQSTIAEVQLKPPKIKKEVEKPTETLKELNNLILTFRQKKIKSFSKQKEKEQEEREREQEREEAQSKRDEIADLRKKIKELNKRLKRARAQNNSSLIRSIESQLKRLRIKLKKITESDFVSDMKHFHGPITRSGSFEYEDTIKIKDFNNLVDVFGKISHLPAFDSHDENRVIGFAYDFEPNEEEGYIYARGFTFDDIEEITQDRTIDNSIRFPVSIRFSDGNAGKDTPLQNLEDVIHLAVSTQRNEQDRCSTGDGKPCYVVYSDFVDPSQENKTMPTEEKKSGKKEEEEEEEDKEDDFSSPSETDEEYNRKKENDRRMKEKEDFSKDSVSLTRKEYEDFIKERQEAQRLISDFKEREKQRIAAEVAKIKSDFVEDEHKTYTIKSDFVNGLGHDELKVLQNALVPVIQKEKGKTPDPFQALNDFNVNTSTSDTLAKKWGWK